MKIFIQHETDELIPLSHHLTLEGNDICTDQSKADLVICEGNSMVHDDRFIYSHVKFPHAVLKALGLDIHFARTNYFFTKWYDYKKGWGKQCFVGVPVYGLMDGGLSAQLPTVTCGRYVENDLSPGIFHSDVLQGFLNDLACRSFVSVEYSEDHEITSISTGVPFNGLYNLLEGAKGSLGEFFLEPFKNRFIESWTTNLLVSRFPFPSASASDKITIHHVTPEIEKHLWFFDITRFRRSISTTSTKVALVTAWGETLLESNRRALRTAFGLNVPLKQFRLDAVRHAGSVFDSLGSVGVV